MDLYKALRELPFTTVAGALGIDLGKFKPRKEARNGLEAALSTSRRRTARASAMPKTASSAPSPTPNSSSYSRESCFRGSRAALGQR
jgi:hypothetical protein